MFLNQFSLKIVIKRGLPSKSCSLQPFRVGFATSCWGLQGNTNPQGCFVRVFQLTETVESVTGGAGEEEETLVCIFPSLFCIKI